MGIFLGTMRIKSFFGVSNAKQNTAACISYTDAAIWSYSTDLCHHELFVYLST